MFVLAFSSLIILVHSTCINQCSTCVGQNSSTLSHRCTSCPTGYFLSGQSCLYCGSLNSTQCRDYSSYIPTTADIVVPIITSIALIFIFCCCCRLICQKCSEFNRQQRAAISNQLAPNRPSQMLNVYHPPSIPNSVPEVSMHQLQISCNWKTDHHRFNQKEICVFCLQDEVCLQTNCKHSFHPSCIWLWVSKKHADCPLCKSKQMSPVKIFCRKCFMSYFQVDTRLIQGMVGEKKWKNCLECQKSQIL